MSCFERIIETPRERSVNRNRIVLDLVQILPQLKYKILRTFEPKLPAHRR